MATKNQSSLELKTVTRSVNLFEPAAPGRPAVPWVEGLNPDLVREQWPTWGDELPNTMTLMAWYRKLVIYEKANPAIRFVVLFYDPEILDGRRIQRVAKYTFEWEPQTPLKAIRRAQNKLGDEFCKVELRGRPRGTGHPKRPLPQHFPISSQTVDLLRKAGLDDKDLQILFRRSQRETLGQIGRALRMTAQGVAKRWKRRIEPAIKTLNPNFSNRSFTLSSLDSI